MRRTSIVLYAVLTAGFVVNVVGIPRTIEIRPSEIEIERPPHVYMLKDSRKRLRGLPFLQVVRNVSLADTSRTSVRLYEDGKPLGDPFSTYEDMIKVGAGAYLGRYDRLSFTTSDNSDPRTNGRRYAAKLRIALDWGLLMTLLVVIVVPRAIIAIRCPSPVPKRG
jgi:hypothetical protein